MPAAGRRPADSLSTQQLPDAAYRSYARHLPVQRPYMWSFVAASWPRFEGLLRPQSTQAAVIRRADFRFADNLICFGDSVPNVLDIKLHGLRWTVGEHRAGCCSDVTAGAAVARGATGASTVFAPANGSG
eukprot:COSAG04_NODE_2134_length_4727_cov_1.982930_3_plen_130_part_00